MKKHLFLVAVGALAMASCSKDEQTSINKGNAIDFRVAMGTRGAETTTGNLNKIFVTALKGTEQFFTDLEFNKVGTNFSSDPKLYYWPGDGSTLNFYAYAPSAADLGATVTIDNTTKTLANFTPNATIANQKDFISVNATGNKTANEAAGVYLQFEHRLAQIGIAAKNSSTTYKYTVSGVELRNIPSTATFNFDNNTWNTPTIGVDYVFDVTAKELTADFANFATTDNAMLIPQTLSALATGNRTGAYIAVNVKIETLAGSVVHDGWVAAPINTTWTAGNKYIYQLDFTKGAGVDPDEPDKPILGEAIFFTVDVTEWNAVDEPIEM